MQALPLRVMDLGLRDYEEAWQDQLGAAEEVAQGGPDTLILVEHPPVLTLGAAFHEANLLFAREEYQSRGIQVVKTDRGGDVTYHAPGQLVIYPVFDVSRHGRDLHQWMRNLEEAMLRTLAEFGLQGGRVAGRTGAWVEDRKIASIGVKMKRWVSIHGIALNCSCDMTPFTWIIPCGIDDRAMTSLSRELGRTAPVEEAKPAVIRAFQAVFSVSAAAAA